MGNFRAVSMSGGTVALGDDQNHNFNELSASIEASIAAKKQEALQDQRRIGGLQSNVDAMNDRCSMLEMAMERERSERMQDTSEMQTQISREMHKLWEALKQVSVPVHVFKALEDRVAK